MNINSGNQKGFTLMSVLIALAVIAFLISAVFGMYAQAARDANAKALIDDVRWVLAKARDSRGVEHTNSLGSTLYVKGLIPEDWIHDGGTSGWFDSRWGRTSVGGTGNWFGENPDGFNSLDGVHLFFGDVPQDICFEVINTLQSEVDYISYRASDNGGKGITGVLKSPEIEYSREAATQQCDDGSNNGSIAPSIRLAVYR